MMHFLKILSFVILMQCPIECRKHQHNIKDDHRGFIPVSSFGFYKGGSLQVEVKKFVIKVPEQSVSLKSSPVGFSLEKISNGYTDHHTENCELESKFFKQDDSMVQQVFFLFDLTANNITLMCSSDMKNLSILNDTSQITVVAPSNKNVADSTLFSKKTNGGMQKKEPSTSTAQEHAAINPFRNYPWKKCSEAVLPMTRNENVYNFSFGIFISRDEEEGLYNLNFHNCFNNDQHHEIGLDMQLTVEEKNPHDNYLSAGEMPLPALYSMMSLLFFLCACFWFFLLKKSKHPVFKIHYLMGVLVIIKSLSLLFHGMNYHFIQKTGAHIEGFAVMYYIMHLLKGALLFTVLALIGSGWAFIKHVLSQKEKKIFMIVIPLQIIANVATVIIEETEESNSERAVWVQLFFLLDFLCCGAILLPVVWSIRHLQEASQTDGKAAINLSKLKLFRHFYIMIVCYIYVTRIIAYLLKITVPFQYAWLDEMFREMATYIFFVMTGYKFRPATNNPYFRVDPEEELDEVLTTTGLTEGVTRVNQSLSKTKAKPIRKNYEFEVNEDDEEINLLTETKESSHELD